MATSSEESRAQQQEALVTVDDLPVTFQVKYLGQYDAGGLWGIKHTRRPVDNMVAAAKNLPSDEILPLVRLEVSTEGVRIASLAGEKRNTFNIESISYGVQDLIYTRVFSMIVVKEVDPVNRQNPFDCHAFVCDSKSAARKLTYALAAAFQHYSERVKQAQMSAEQSGDQQQKPVSIKKRFAIDLRTPDEMMADMEETETEA